MTNSFELAESELNDAVKRLKQIRKIEYEANKTNLANKKTLKAIQTLHWQYKEIRSNKYYQETYSRIKEAYTRSKWQLWKIGLELKVLKCNVKDKQRKYEEGRK